ncbi:DedA family protein [Corynebacterium epidermidicanis]|uniref:Putative membrane-associated protein n=1 Tax=Corynebacterium epidermidicanis TaxID=1050174 RepID=A0A0G3GSZ7_9CORY|nr:DedA family protein [Corynebacterium epidermidicanis]AKK02643.1 putative membrane-associated protein [Corynebacterium epidermidicanis]
MQKLIDWVVSLMGALGAPGVGIAIFLENIFPPIPSELILPLAGFTVGQGGMNFIAALVWATVGSILGALLLYWVGAKFGAQRLRQIADWMWLTEPEDVDNSLDWFQQHGQWSVFFARLIPGVRSLISIPAGIDRMSLPKFTMLTAAGSLLWNAVLIGLGMWLGERYHVVSDVIDKYSTVIYAIIAAAISYVVYRMWRRKERRKARRRRKTTS